jgi:hypothetical protein
MAITSIAREFVHNQYQWIADDVMPPITDVWLRLQVPEWSVYKDALRHFAQDSYTASQSTHNLLFLTFRPVIILLTIVVKFLWKNLLEHGSKSLQKGLHQLKYAAIEFYKFQWSLTRTELLGELALLGVFVGLYYVHKWLKQQTYWSRFVAWFRQKKHITVQVR